MPDSPRLRLKCNGVIIPVAPSDVRIETYNVSSENTGRNQNAVMYQKVVRRGVQKVILSFKGLTDTQISELYNWTQSYGGKSGTNKTTVDLTYNDPRTKNVITKKGYFGAETEVHWIWDNTKNLIVEETSFSWIEV